MARLVAEEGMLKGLVLSLEEGDQWIIGRDPDACQLLIEDPAVSRKHLLCRSTPDGIILENLSSTNPVQINDEELKEPHTLQNGDTVKIGNGVYRFYSEPTPHFIDGENHSITEENPTFSEENPTFNEETPTEMSNEESEEPIENKPEINERKEEVNEEETNKENPTENQETALPSENSEIKEEVPKEEQQPEIANEEEPKDQEEEKIPQENEPEMNVIPETEEEKTSFINQPENEEEEEPDTIFEDETFGNKENLAEINFDLTETGRWLLKVIGGPNTGAEFAMQTDSTYLIGTDPNTCDIVFHDTSVSRQHARVSVTEDDQLTIEDLKSRNGTLVDGEPVKGKQTLLPNVFVTMGTTSFIVFDREGEMQTIISPLLPSIVKVLQKEETKPEVPVSPTAEAAAPVETQKEAAAAEKPKENAHSALGAFILIAIITGLFVIIGIGTTTLFKNEPVAAKEQVNPDKVLQTALAPFPDVKYSFNNATGRLLLVGHVLTITDRNQLMYNLQGLTSFIKSIDDSGVIIDEGVWREINQVLARNPDWKGISVHSPSPGHFVLSGYLQTRKQAEQLWDYVGSNFPYLDLLERRVIVEEDVVSSVSSMLLNHGFKDVAAQIANGEITLSGTIPNGKLPEYEKLIPEFKNIPGVRNVKNFVTEIAPEQSMINISDKYEVTGVSHQGKVNTSVVINGRILTRGDTLDGMTITSIKPNAIFLEKDGVKYRIDYNK